MWSGHPGLCRISIWIGNYYSERFSKFCRLIRFDKRGTGLSELAADDGKTRGAHR